jgi:lactate permease
MNYLILLFSVLPIFVFIYFLIVKRSSLLVSSLLAFILTLIAVVFFWKIAPSILFVSIGKGFLIALDIFIIIFGAIFFLEILKGINVIDNVSYYLKSVSKDYRVQIILLAWFLENFLEGTSGFGTPSIVVAPLLMGVGLSPLLAAAVSLLGNSTSVIFGAAGTPIRVGFSGLEVLSVPHFGALFNLVGFLVPVFMLWAITAKKIDGKKQFWEALPFSIWAGILFVVPSLLIVPLGQEFPSILGAIIGLILMILTIKLKIFTPKNIRTLEIIEKPKNSLSLLKTILPYGALLTLLVLGKLLLGNLSINIPFFGHNFSIFNPGWAFFGAGIVTIILFKEETKHFWGASKVGFIKSLEPFLVIVLMSAVVQLMINSGVNSTGNPSSLMFLAGGLKTKLLPFISPFVGMFGSFVTGSATVSNIMFGKILAVSAQLSSFNIEKILALLLVGGAAGNMIALADMLTAETVVGLKNKERDIIKQVGIPCLIYAVLVAIIGMLVV